MRNFNSKDLREKVFDFSNLFSQITFATALNSIFPEKFLANILIKKYWSRLKFDKLLQSSTQLVNLELNKSLVSEVFLYYKIGWLYLVDCRLTPRQLDSAGHFCATGLYSARRNLAALRLLLYKLFGLIFKIHFFFNYDKKKLHFCDFCFLENHKTKKFVIFNKMCPKNIPEI